MFTLGQAAQWLSLECEGYAHQSVAGAAIDSRKIKPGMLFIACSGDQVDGHDFVHKAAEAGACGAIVKKSWKGPSLPDDFVLLKYDSVLDGFQKLAKEYRKLLQYPIIAITGTNGKTTTKEMMVTVLGQGASVVKNEGNLNNHLGVPLTLLNWPIQADYGVLEMGMNHPGEIKDLCGIALPTHGVITNVGEGHLEFLGSISGVAKAKAELLYALSKTGVGFVNGDDEQLKPFHHIAKETITFGFGQDNDVHGQVVNYTEWGCPVLGVETQQIEMQVPGDHNAMNALAVNAVAQHFNFDRIVIKQGLETFHGYSGRLDLLKTGDVWIIDDTYNANPSSMEVAIDVLASFKSAKRRVAILGDMLELGSVSKSAHVAVGQMVVNQNIDLLIGVGQEMRVAVENASELNQIEAVYYENQETCLADLGMFLKSGDGILVKGSRGMKMENVVSAIKEIFEN